MKNKKIKNILKEISYWLVIFTFSGSLLAYGLYRSVCEAQDYVPTYSSPEVIIPEKLSMKEWVLNEVKRAGLNPKEAECIIKHESQWREDVCIIEPNKTISCGLWMINTVHNKKGITNACKVNYKCATKFAIEKRLEDKSWNAWTQWKLCK